MSKKSGNKDKIRGGRGGKPPKKSHTDNKTVFKKRFPFWARINFEKHRTTLVIDETEVTSKKTEQKEPGFVHREATHTQSRNTEKKTPNPDKSDPRPMYLKRPRKHPKRLFKPHNKDLSMPKSLKDKYDKNNKKDK